MFFDSHFNAQGQDVRSEQIEFLLHEEESCCVTSPGSLVIEVASRLVHHSKYL